MFDLDEFIKAATVNTTILIPIIMALVTLYGRFGAQGRVQLALSVLTGFVLGVSVLIADLGVPSSFGGWVMLVIYGMIPGLVASGVYDTGKKIVKEEGNG